MNRQKQLHTYLCEAEVVEGLELVAADELRRFSGVQLQNLPRERDGYIRFKYSGELWRLQSLRMSQAVYLVGYFDVPRPRALLGDQNLRIVNNQINTIRERSTKGLFQTLEIAAAGANSSTMQRIKGEISTKTGLEPAKDKGDLLLRIIPARGKKGWETLVRLTPRPLATRNWRECNFEGALNATVAATMISLSRPRESDIYVNLGSGSGTLIIERAIWGTAKHVIGIDNNPSAHDCADKNIRASYKSKQIINLLGDMTTIPLHDRTANIVTADLPFGQRVGSHQDNLSLYPLVFKEAGRITSRGGEFIFISHEVKLVERLLSSNTDWAIEQELRINLRGLHPRIYRLRRL
jgi:tRNA (guanine6-N2)-methyltransferase